MGDSNNNSDCSSNSNNSIIHDSDWLIQPTQAALSVDDLPSDEEEKEEFQETMEITTDSETTEETQKTNN